MTSEWKDGNTVRLLENGEAFFPRVFAAIAEAQHEILLETFILFEDKVGNQLHRVLIDAARRGVKVEMTVDGFGSAELTPAYISALTSVGVRLRMFDPGSKVGGIRLNVFRRLHRKIVVIDGVCAFVGGINFSADHLGDFGPEAKQDYTIEVQGPVVADIHRFALEAIATPETSRSWRRPRWPKAASTASNSDDSQRGVKTRFVYRDNDQHRNDIEQHYLQAIRNAHSRVVIANAYFFPGYRLLRELRNAARRGVQVRLILQGQPDMPIAQLLARLLYNYLLRDGVEIYEYCQRPLHGKVALVDDTWSTVGSSNLDPLSLSLNLEANLLISDAHFNQELYLNLDNLVTNHCKRMSLERVVRGYFWRAPLIFLCFHFLRHFPAIAGWLPAHRPRLALLQDEDLDEKPLPHEKINESH